MKNFKQVYPSNSASPDGDGADSSTAWDSISDWLAGIPLSDWLASVGSEIIVTET